MSKPTMSVTKLELEEDAHRAALEDNPSEVHVGWKTWAAVLSMAISFGPPIGIAFGSVAAVVAPVTQELGGFDKLAWVVGAWSLATACSFSVSGALSDTFGRRNPILLGQVLSIVGFIMGGVARNVETLIAAEAFIGFSTGLIFVSYAGVPEMLPNKYRSLGLGILDGGIALPWGVIAVILGQALLKYASWRWIFWIALIVEVVGLAGTAAFYWPASRTRGSRLQQLKDIDWIGLTAFIGGLAVLLVGLTWGGQAEHPWAGASVVAPIVVGLVTIVAAFAYDFTVATNPIFPLSLFRQFREYSVLLIVMFVSGMLYNALLPLLTQGSSYMFTQDGILVGLMSLPYTTMTLIVGCIVPMLAHKIGHLKWQVVVAVTLQTTFIAATAGAVNPRNYWGWIFLPAFGIPMFTWLTILTYAIASLHVPHSKLGVAMGLLGTFRAAGGAVGNAIFSTILNNKFNEYVGEEVVPLVFMNGFNATDIGPIIGGAIQHNLGIPFALAAYPPSMAEPLMEAVRTAYGRAFYVVFLCTIPFSAVALVFSFFVEDPTKYMTNHVQMAMEAKVEDEEVQVVAEKQR
ncbi:hypothetical protein RB600_010215 [Gaeumannomyces tritici]